MTRPLVLASGSPRRRDLLTQAGFDFQILTPSIVETESRSLTVREVAIANATRKAMAVARDRFQAVVVGADTLVALDGEIIGKPSDMAAAEECLRRLSGRWHKVWTAVYVCCLAQNRASMFYEVSDVRFRKLTDAKIDRYLARVDPLDKAGGYAAQGVEAAEIIARIKGSRSNVIGLPMEKTTKILQQFGVTSRPNPLTSQPVRAPARKRGGDARPALARGKGTKR